MNSENFPEFLNDSSKLYSISFQELQSLVMEYPFSNSLWKLLLCKAYFENKGDFQKIQESLAIRIQDRTKLKYFVQRLESLKIEYDIQMENRQVLDLEQLKEKAIQRAMETEDFPEEEQIKEKQKEHQRTDLLNKLFAEDSANETSTEEIAEEKTDIEQKAAQPASAKFTVDQAIVMNISAVSLAISKLNISGESISSTEKLSKKSKDKKKKYSPVPKSKFKSWTSKDDKKKKSKKHNKPLKAKSLAAKSLKNNHKIVSETLAQILEEQGYFDKAIQMYEQLCLKIPEKIPLFEAKINNLKDRR